MDAERAAQFDDGWFAGYILVSGFRLVDGVGPWGLDVCMYVRVVRNGGHAVKR